MKRLAIIGGTGLGQLSGVTDLNRETVDTPYGTPSAAIVRGNSRGLEVLFLARHGNPHHIAPHKINYRANLWALKQLGVTDIVAVAAVGGITQEMGPTQISIPDQIIDYTFGREHTFFDGGQQPLQHIDFTHPYHEPLRQSLLAAASQVAIAAVPYGTYGCTQGPRLESIAEIRRLERDGCDLVGMTAMPEAALAKELDVRYASMAVVANWAAGKSAEEITMAEIDANLHIGMANVGNILQALFQNF